MSHFIPYELQLLALDKSTLVDEMVVAGEMFCEDEVGYDADTLQSVVVEVDWIILSLVCDVPD